MKDLLAKSGLKLSDFDLIEVNEAFAAKYLSCERELGLKREITNVNGSGCGLGHPVGSTGCRLLVTLLYAMRRRRLPATGDREDIEDITGPDAVRGVYPP